MARIHALVAPALVLAAVLAPPPAAAVTWGPPPPGAGPRRISWWWDGRVGHSPDASALATFASANADIVDGVMLDCGVGVQPDGTIGGDFSPACAEAAAGLRAAGAAPEVWLGEADSTAAARLLFGKPEEAAAALVSVARTHGIEGFNFDLEPKDGSNSTDAARYGALLAAIRPALAAAGARLTADAASWTPLLADIGEWAKSVDRAFWMSTYYAASPKQWYYRLKPALGAAPVDRLGGGLAVFTDERTAGWADTAESAEYRLCWFANLSVPELGLFRVDVARGWPGKRWLAPLRAYKSGATCDPGPAPEPCPAPFTGYDAGGCCTLHYSPQCERQCAEDRCEALPGNWTWKIVDWRTHPYTCCPPADEQRAGNWETEAGGGARRMGRGPR